MNQIFSEFITIDVEKNVSTQYEHLKSHHFFHLEPIRRAIKSKLKIIKSVYIIVKSMDCSECYKFVEL